MAAAIPNEVHIVCFQLFIWDEDFNDNALSGFQDREQQLYQLFRIAEALQNDTPPDLVTETKDWAEFIINVIVDYMFDFGLNNVKGDLNPPTIGSIADEVVTMLGQNPNTWPVNANQDVFDTINELLNPTQPD